MTDTPRAAWDALHPAAARSLELAHRALLSEGLAVGSVIVDRHGTIVAEGRNRAYDDRTATDALERTPIAHAEMNAMAGLDTEVDTAELTLWTTQRPCSMCRAAIEFIGIGAVVAVAADPSEPAQPLDEQLADHWVLLATAMFLYGPLRRGGPEQPMVWSNRPLEPEAVALAERAMAPGHPLADGRSLRDAVAAIWDELEALATDRAERLGHAA